MTVNLTILPRPHSDLELSTFSCPRKLVASKIKLPSVTNLPKLCLCVDTTSASYLPFLYTPLLRILSYTLSYTFSILYYTILNFILYFYPILYPILFLILYYIGYLLILYPILFSHPICKPNSNLRHLDLTAGNKHFTTELLFWDKISANLIVYPTS